MPRTKGAKNKNQLRMIGDVEKPCFYCEKPIESGRPDKRFCNDTCRSAYNNAIRQAENCLIRNINHSLYKNRRILNEVLSSGKAKVKKSFLSKAGYEFKYYTHNKVNKNDNLYFYCYDVGYLPLEKEMYLIVKDNTPYKD